MGQCLQQAHRLVQRTIPSSSGTQHGRGPHLPRLLSLLHSARRLRTVCWELQSLSKLPQPSSMEQHSARPSMASSARERVQSRLHHPALQRSPYLSRQGLHQCSPQHLSPCCSSQGIMGRQAQTHCMCPRSQGLILARCNRILSQSN